MIHRLGQEQEHDTRLKLLLARTQPLARGINCNLHRVCQVAGQAGGAVHGVPCEPGAADGGGNRVSQGGGDHVDRVSRGGKLVVWWS